MHRFWLVSLVFLGCGVCAAQPPALRLPAFAGLQHDAVERVDFSIGPSVLGLLGQWVGESDPQSAAAMRALRGVRDVQIHNFRFHSDHAYSGADLEALRSQLTPPSWHPLIHVRNHDQEGDVDVYYALENRAVTGLTILAAEPRELTIVHILGSVELEEVAALSHLLIGSGSVSHMLVATP